MEIRIFFPWFLVFKFLQIFLNFICALIWTILNWEVGMLDDREFIMIWVTMCNINYKVIRFKFCYLLTWYYNWRQDISLILWLSDFQKLSSFTISEYIVLFKNLSLVRNHINFRFNFTWIILTSSQHNSDEGRERIAWFVKDSVLFLESSSHTNFMRRQESIMIYGSENPANFFEAESFSNSINNSFIFIF